MTERRLDGELERIARFAAFARAAAAHDHQGDGGPGALDAGVRSVLRLQATAGNTAVAGALRVQRQPKQPPAYVTNAQATLKQLFPKEKLLQGVVIKDYVALNPALQGASYGAWTQSATQIYVRDPALLADTPQKQAMAMQYALQHEANHVRQFAKAKGPPAKWETMMKYELDAYANDLRWLAGTGKSIVTDAELHRELVDGATKNLKDLQDLMKGAAKLKGAKREAFFLDGLLDKDLIPPDSTANPLDLYKQSP